MVDGNDDITRYQNNEMTEKERNAFERKALNDPFLSDALDGAEEIRPEEFAGDIEALSRRIHPRSSLKWKMSLRIAAGIILVITAGYLVYRNNPPEPDQLASTKMDSTTFAKSDSASNLLTLADPKAAPEIETHSDSQPKTEVNPLAQAPTESTSPVSGEGIRAEPKTEKVAEPETEIAPERAEADAEISKVQDSRKSKADESVNRMAKEGAPQRSAGAVLSSVAKRTISGQVTEAEDHIPLPGVSVLDKETTTITQTDLEGRYSIQVASQNPALQYSFHGLETLVVNPGDRIALDVQLKDDASVRSEVVVLRSESSLANDSPVTLATPVGGIPRYSQYLEDNRRVPKAAQAAKVSGKVTIAFNVTPTGTLTGFVTVKSLGYGCDEEVVRLIEDGPTWKPSSRNGIPLPTTVWVKVEFISGK